MDGAFSLKTSLNHDYFDNISFSLSVWHDPQRSKLWLTSLPKRLVIEILIIILFVNIDKVKII